MCGCSESDWNVLPDVPTNEVNASMAAIRKLSATPLDSRRKRNVYDSSAVLGKCLGYVKNREGFLVHFFK